MLFRLCAANSVSSLSLGPRHEHPFHGRLMPLIVCSHMGTTTASREGPWQTGRLSVRAPWAGSEYPFYHSTSRPWADLPWPRGRKAAHRPRACRRIASAAISPHAGFSTALTKTFASCLCRLPLRLPPPPSRTARPVCCFAALARPAATADRAPSGCFSRATTGTSSRSRCVRGLVVIRCSPRCCLGRSRGCCVTVGDGAGQGRHTSGSLPTSTALGSGLSPPRPAGFGVFYEYQRQAGGRRHDSVANDAATPWLRCRSERAGALHALGQHELARRSHAAPRHAAIAGGRRNECCDAGILNTDLAQGGARTPERARPQEPQARFGAMVFKISRFLVWCE